LPAVTPLGSTKNSSLTSRMFVLGPVTFYTKGTVTMFPFPSQYISSPPVPPGSKKNRSVTLNWLTLDVIICD